MAHDMARLIVSEATRLERESVAQRAAAVNMTFGLRVVWTEYHQQDNGDDFETVKAIQAVFDVRAVNGGRRVSVSWKREAQVPQNIAQYEVPTDVAFWPALTDLMAGHALEFDDAVGVVGIHGAYGPGLSPLNVPIGNPRLFPDDPARRAKIAEALLRYIVFAHTRVRTTPSSMP